MAIETKPATTVPERFRDMTTVMEEYPGSRFNLLVPSVYQETSALFRPALSTIRLSADPKSGDCYQTPGSSDKVSPSAVALKRLSVAAGLSWENADVTHPDGAKWIAVGKAAATFVSNTGEVIRVARSYRLDLSDDGVVAERIKRTSKDPRRDLDQKRQFIDQLAETGAISRVVRDSIGMRTSYRPEDFEKSFIAVKFVPDDSNPLVQAALLRRIEGGNRDVFGPASAIAAPETPTRELPATAGRAEEDDEADELEPRVARATASTPEPEIPDDAPGADDGEQVAAIAAEIIRSVGRSAEAGKPVDKDGLATLGVAIRDVLGLKGKIPGPAIADVRLAIARLVFGAQITTATQLTTGQAKALVERTKELLGQEQIKTLFGYALAHDPALADAKRELGR